MKNKILWSAALLATSTFALAGCSSTETVEVPVPIEVPTTIDVPSDFTVYTKEKAHVPTKYDKYVVAPDFIMVPVREQHWIPDVEEEYQYPVKDTMFKVSTIMWFYKSKYDDNECSVHTNITTADYYVALSFDDVAQILKAHYDMYK